MRCPTGSPAYVERWCQQWLETHTRGLRELGGIGDPHAGMVIFRECVVSRAVHFIRMLPPVGPWVYTLRAFDRQVWECVLRLLVVDERLLVQPDTGAPSGRRDGVALRLAAAQRRLMVSRGALRFSPVTAAMSPSSPKSSSQN